ncbi:DUF3267 domain-containing protein [Marinilabiliaceae bacterium JC017]|nr:DUF3267 domain-containing protein [Marinilabiliaceae bacterium JC017]
MKEHTISVATANMMGFGLLLPILLVTGIPYILVNGFTIGEMSVPSIVILFAVMIPGIVIHELLHGIVWALCQKQGWKVIHFGFNKEWLTPYCHCSVPMKVWCYSLGGVMPLIVLGILPVIIGTVYASFAVWIFGAFFSIAAGGDIIALWMIRKFPRHQLVQDHPEKMGFILID